jgi:hypothetical protein
MGHPRLRGRRPDRGIVAHRANHHRHASRDRWVTAIQLTVLSMIGPNRAYSIILGKVCRSLANFTGFTIPRRLGFAHVDENQPSRALIPRVYLGRTSAQALRA